MKRYKTYLVSILFGLLAASQASAQSIVGAWTSGSTTVEGASTVVFFPNGFYIQIQNAKASEAPHGVDGFERGTYSWNAQSGALTINTIQDLNGDTGLSNISGVPGITFVVSGDTATITVPGSSAISGTRVTGASPIVGAWGGANAAPDDSGVLVFLPNGVYFMADDGDSISDPSGHDGIEHGTYSWNAATGVITSATTPAPYVDTNGKWGLSDSHGTIRISPDLLTLTIADGTDTFVLPRIGAAGAAPITPVGGVWWNPLESGSGYGLDFKDGVLLVQIYSYLAGGAAQWYLAAGAVTNNTFTATLDKYTGGQCISCAYKGTTIAGNDGQTTFTFTSPTTANVTLPGGRQIQIQRYFQPPTVVAPAPAITPVGGVWWNPNESGSGYGIDFQNGVLLVQIYSYLAGGPAQWYLAAGAVTNNVFTATLDKYTGGQCISCAYQGPTIAGNDGQTTFTFTSPTTANVTLPGGRQIQIQRYFQP